MTVKELEEKNLNELKKLLALNLQNLKPMEEIQDRELIESFEDIYNTIEFNYNPVKEETTLNMYVAEYFYGIDYEILDYILNKIGPFEFLNVTKESFCEEKVVKEYIKNYNKYFRITEDRRNSARSILEELIDGLEDFKESDFKEIGEKLKYLKDLNNM